MPKSIVVAGAIASLVLIAGGAVSAMALHQPSSSPQPSAHILAPTTTPYHLFSDTSIIRYPDAGVEFGSGQQLVFGYDGSKSEHDPTAQLWYDLYYVSTDSTVRQMGGAPLDGRGSGLFSTASLVFNPKARGLKGLLKLSVSYHAAADTGKLDAYGLPLIRLTELGLYSITYDIPL